MTQLKINDPQSLPSRSEFIAWGRFVEMSRVEPATVAELLEMGWLDPVRTGADEYLFRSHDVYRIQKLMRLCRDLEISFAAGSIIVDLLDRVERLEQELSELKRLL
ncbi:MAG: chaperone modulator CbpM [Humidesulfovibrio sp.]|jgi:chaperone modulatory protein CbpM|uniref:chaperone modulator CbpM n=1 Tax=Humidesulfovibrio sp. TaxID=2910988 RepID=UPI002735CCE7|nr:chaperone modulator CbpM [Humidesulfovibrio sp.]MDP2847182.1 chaperone modulator CbpM [Humidesulfovibrio sp.]